MFAAISKIKIIVSAIFIHLSLFNKKSANTSLRHINIVNDDLIGEVLKSLLLKVVLLTAVLNFMEMPHTPFPSLTTALTLDNAALTKASRMAQTQASLWVFRSIISWLYFRRIMGAKFGIW